MSEARADRLEQARRRGYALLAGHVHEDATGEAVPVATACATPD